jgi:hypothetical protein
MPDAGGDAATSDAASSSGAGLVSLTRVTTGGVLLSGMFSTEDIASMRRGLLDPSCSLVVEMGACRVLSCPTSIRTQDAGNVRAGLRGTSLAVAMRPAAGLYVQPMSGTAVSSGDVVTLDATGGVDVPAFTVDVAVPPFPTVTLPATVDRTMDLVISWGATTADSTQVVLGSGSNPATECIVPGNAGTVTIPAALVGRYPAGPGVLAFSVFDSQTIVAGGHTIDGQAAMGTSADLTFQ